MKPILIAGNALRRLMRDRTAIFFTLVFPVVLMFLIGSATARFDDAEFPVGVVASRTGPLGAELVRSLDREPALVAERYEDRAALAKAVRRGVVAAGVLVPSGYTETLRAGGTARVELLADQTRGFPAAVRSLVSEVVAEQGAELQAASFATSRAGGTFEGNLRNARRTSELFANVAVGVEARTVGREEESDYLPPGIGYQAPAQLVLFVFITSLAGAALLIDARRLGVTRRALATPTAARTVIAGEILGRFTIAAFQALFIFVVASLVFGVEWGNPAGAAVLILLIVLVATSLATLFGTVLRTSEQAGALGPALGIPAGMLGGCMWPLEIVPDPMRIAGHAFPHAWAMDAWIDLIGRGTGVGAIVPELAVLAGFVAVLLPLATWRLRRAVFA